MNVASKLRHKIDRNGPVSMLALFYTLHLGGTRHEVRTHSVSGDSGYRIDGYRSACLGSGLFGARRSLLQTRSCEGAFARNGTRDGGGYTWTSHSGGR